MLVGEGIEGRRNNTTRSAPSCVNYLAISIQYSIVCFRRRPSAELRFGLQRWRGEEKVRTVDDNNRVLDSESRELERRGNVRVFRHLRVGDEV
jgi:hypothetical protein